MSLKEKAASIWSKLVKQYRMVLYEQESLSQSRHVFFKPITAILLGFAGFVVVFGLAYLLIYAIPGIGGNIPGFDSPLSEDYKSLQRKNNQLEREVAEMGSMLSVLSQVMGDSTKPAANGKMFDSGMPEPANTNPLGQEMSAQEALVQVSQSMPPQQGNPEPKVAPTPNPNSELAAAASAAAAKGPIILNLVPPIDGYVTKDFEPKDKPHFGIDLAAEENSLVRAVAPGVIIFSEYSNTTGYVVGIWHSQSNLLSFYKHNSRIFKTVGSYVFAGEAIAVIGNTGINSSGTHLHFELWYDNNPVNPADYIKFN